MAKLPAPGQPLPCAYTGCDHIIAKRRPGGIHIIDTGELVPMNAIRGGVMCPACGRENAVQYGSLLSVDERNESWPIQVSR